jgi:hypothetical protein
MFVGGIILAGESNDTDEENGRKPYGDLVG